MPLHVSVQLHLVAKTLFTLATRERVGLTVQLLVVFQFKVRDERLATHVADIRQLPCMIQKMISQGSRLHK